MRRAHRPATEAARGRLAPVHGPWACAGATGPPHRCGPPPYKGPRGGPPLLPGAPTPPLGEEAPLWGIGGLRRVRPRARYPQTVATWERAQAGSRRSRSFPPTGAPRRASPTGAGGAPSTNAIESLNYQLRKGDQEPRPLLSSDEAAVKSTVASTPATATNAPANATRTRANPPANAPPHPVSSKANSPPTAKQALAQLTTAYPDRITPYL